MRTHPDFPYLEYEDHICERCGKTFKRYRMVPYCDDCSRAVSERRTRAATFNAKNRAAILERDGHKCLACGSTRRLTLDHIVPVFRGGEDELDNIQTLCRKCNDKKHTQIIDYRKGVCDE